MCGGTGGSILKKVTGGGGGGMSEPTVIGQPETAKTQIGDSGAPAVVAAGGRRKPRSLLGGAALGDVSVAPVTVAGAKPTLGA